MAIPSNIKTPGVYTEINTQTKRTGLPAQDHKVLLLVSDDSEGAGAGNGGLETVATQAQADAISGDKTSNLSRMTRAALATTLALSMQVASASVPGGGSGGGISCVPLTYNIYNPVIDQEGTAYITVSVDDGPDQIVTFDIDINTVGSGAYLIFRSLVSDDLGLSALIANHGTGRNAAFVIRYGNFDDHELRVGPADENNADPHKLTFSLTEGLGANEFDLAALIFGEQLTDTLSVITCSPVNNPAL